MLGLDYVTLHLSCSLEDILGKPESSWGPLGMYLVIIGRTYILKIHQGQLHACT